MRTVPFQVPVKVLFGAGIINSVGDPIKALGIKKLLILFDQGIEKAGIAGKVVQVIRDADISFVTDNRVVPDPTDVSVDAIADAARENHVDGILAVGGGSTIDTGKCVKFLLSHEGSINQYYGLRACVDDGVPLVSVPTTAGTGSEVTMGAMVTDTSRGVKGCVANAYIMSNLAVVDPELTVGCPPHISAACAFDVLSHAIDSCTSNANSMVAQTVNHSAIRLFKDNFQRIYANGQDIEARTNIHLASLLGGVAIFNGGVQVCHSFAHAFGALYHVPHGEACAMFTPACLEYNTNVWPKECVEIAALLGVEARPGEEAIDTVKRLSSTIRGMAKSVGLRGIEEFAPLEDVLARVIPVALADGMWTYCENGLTAESAEKIIRRTFDISKGI